MTMIGRLDVCFVSSAPVKRHARASGHPVPVGLAPGFPLPYQVRDKLRGNDARPQELAGIYEMDI